MTTRESFVARFGEQCAGNIERAALGHDRVQADSDVFRWSVLVCLENGCLSVPEYREEHRIEPPWPLLAQWIRESVGMPRWAVRRISNMLPFDYRQRQPRA